MHDTNLRHGGSRWILGLSLVAIGTGCTSTDLRVHEFDATGARDFTWSGKFRIVERETRPLLGAPRHEVTQVVLLGERDRDIIAEPSGQSECRDAPPAVAHEAGPRSSPRWVATLRAPGADVEDALWPTMYFALSRESWTAGHSMQIAARNAAAAAVQRGAYDDVDLSLVVPYAAIFPDAWETRCRLTPDRWLCVRQSPETNPPHVIVTIESSDGTILHTYAPQTLPTMHADM